MNCSSVDSSQLVLVSGHLTARGHVVYLVIAVLFSVFQREAKLQLFREAVDAYAALTDQVNNKETLNSFCRLL